MPGLVAVRKSFAGKVVLDGLTFALAPGRIHGLLGPNGSGKSTAIACLTGTLAVDAGRVDQAPGTRFGIVSQDVALYADLSVRQNLAFFARLHGLHGHGLRQRVAAVIDELALGPFADHLARQLSGGWQRRLHLGIALGLVLDEPTASVDLQARHALWELFRRLRDRGVGLLLTTHHLDEAEELCDHIGLLRQGRLVAEGDRHALAALVPARSVARVEASDAAALRRCAHEQGWLLREYAGGTTLLLPDFPELGELARRLEGVGLRALALQRVGLEHVYCELMAD